MEKNQLIYVLEIAKCGNITKAAENLHLSQPSLSNQIIQLEKELGIPLFERSRKRVYLTEAGEIFAREAASIIRDFTSLKQLMEEYAQQKKGCIRIGALSIMCSLKIPEFVSDFSRQHPDIELSILESGSAALLHALKEKKIDVAFVIMEQSPSLSEQQTALKLFDSNIMVAVPYEWKKDTSSVFTLEDLSEFPLITTTENFHMSSMILSRMDAKNIPYKIISVCNQIDSCLALVNKAMGITFCAEETAEYFHYPNIALIPLCPEIKRTIYLVYQKNPAYHPVLNTFIEEVTLFARQHTLTNRDL